MDIVSLLLNSRGLATTIGGALLGLIGLISIICSVVLLTRRLMTPVKGSGRPISMKVVLMLFILGSMAMVGGLGFFIDLSEGAATTIDQLGA